MSNKYFSYDLYNTETEQVEATENHTADEIRRANDIFRQNGEPQRWVATPWVNQTMQKLRASRYDAYITERERAGDDAWKRSWKQSFQASFGPAARCEHDPKFSRLEINAAPPFSCDAAWNAANEARVKACSRVTKNWEKRSVFIAPTASCS